MGRNHTTETDILKQHTRKHSRLHSGEKPYNYEVCSASFNKTDTLENSILEHFLNYTAGRSHTTEVYSSTFNKTA